jgi:hypothetical protein
MRPAMRSPARSRSRGTAANASCIHYARSDQAITVLMAGSPPDRPQTAPDRRPQARPVAQISVWPGEPASSVQATNGEPDSRDRGGTAPIPAPWLPLPTIRSAAPHKGDRGGDGVSHKSPALATREERASRSRADPRPLGTTSGSAVRDSCSVINGAVGGALAPGRLAAGERKATAHADARHRYASGSRRRTPASRRCGHEPSQRRRNPAEVASRRLHSSAWASMRLSRERSVGTPRGPARSLALRLTPSLTARFRTAQEACRSRLHA